jgi:hypothetical protein
LLSQLIKEWLNFRISQLASDGFNNSGSNFTASGAITAGNDVNIEAFNIELDDDVTSTSGNVLLEAFGTLDIQNVTDNVNAQLQGFEGVTAGDVQSGSGIWVHSFDSTIEVGNLEANQDDGGGNILIQSYGDASTESITIDGSSTTGGLEIDSAQDGSNDVFTIGDDTSNGVNGTITVTTDSGSGNDTEVVGAGILINNAGSEGSGGITLSSMDNIVTGSTSSRNALILLNAGDGTITLPAGTLSDDGASGFGAGQIWLLANTINTDDGTILSASQDPSVAGNNHSVTIGADTLSFGDGDTGLVLHADGQGLGNTGISIGPESTVTIESDDDFPAINWTLNSSGAQATEEEVDFFDGPLTATANGENSLITVGGYPLNFENHSVTLQSQGSSSAHGINIGSTAASTGEFASGLLFVGDGDVLLDASGASSGDSGGTIDLATDGIWTLAPTVTIQADGNGNGNGGNVSFAGTTTDLEGASTVITADGISGEVSFLPGPETLEGTTLEVSADGPSSGDGNAGTVTFTASSTDNSSTSVNLTANGPASGNGNGGTVTFQPASDFTIGGDSAEFAFSATGGSGSGDGGEVDLEEDDEAITIDAAEDNVIDVSAPGTSGNGGTITLTSNNGINFSGSASLAANSSVSGNGGTIIIGTLPTTASITVSSSANPSLEANGADSGVAGYISLSETQPSANLNIGTVNGSINILATGGNNTNTTSPTAGNNCQQSGTTQNVSITTDSTGTVTFDTSGVGISVNATSGSNNQGGCITITTGTVTTNAATTLSALGDGSGSGGGITIVDSTTVSGIGIGSSNPLSLVATGGSTGQGGAVNISNASPAFDVNSVITVDAGAGLTDITKFDGAIALNGTPCQQWKIGSNTDGTGTPRTTWPLTYWDCNADSLTNPTTLDKVPSKLAISSTFDSLRTQFANSTNNVQIYVFKGNTPYNLFWVDGQVAAAGGVTFQKGNHIYSNPWQSGSTGTSAVTDPYLPNQYKEVTAHELGHAVDVGNLLPSQGTPYATYISRDLFDLNDILDPSTSMFIKRLPCAATVFGDSSVSTDTPPFTGVTNMATGNPVCVDGVLNPSDWVSITSNTTVLTSLEGALWNPLVHWTEAHAQMFAYQAVGNIGARPMNDTIMDNAVNLDELMLQRFFACSKAWASAELAGNSSPSPDPSSPSGSCATAP